jgi:hypothetical protein
MFHVLSNKCENEIYSLESFFDLGKSRALLRENLDQRRDTAKFHHIVYEVGLVNVFKPTAATGITDAS